MIRQGMVALLCLAACWACTENKVYHHYNHTSVVGWERVDTLTFEVPRLSESGRYSTDLGLRINGYFPFMSLTMIIEQTIYPSMAHQIDTINCRLADRGGNFKGHGISYYQYRFPISKMNLRRGDSLHITVRHDMRREIMPGISDVGIALTRLR